TADGDTAAYRDTATNSIALQSSDIRLKKNIEDIQNPLQTVLSLHGFLYNTLDEEEDDKKRLGISAQDALAIIPELTFTLTNDQDPNETYYGVHYDKISALLIEAIKEQQITIDSLQAQIAASSTSILSFGSIDSVFESLVLWIADKVINVKELIAERIVGDTIEGNNIISNEKICIGGTCVTEDQFKDLLENSGVASTSPVDITSVVITTSTTTPQAVGGASNPADTVPPTLTLLGNNPANIEVGTTYHDLGVTIEDNVDNNLGYEVWRTSTTTELEYLGRNLTGTTVDTTQASEWGISYVAVDNAGNTATTTRTIIVNDATVVDVVDEEEATAEAGSATSTEEATIDM
ncbi:MAG: tail fiber domain-containing protein, partial [Candidatus Marinimicrobia bacterium]|nr:tail fiber domain-containing protein [Candidatus Neomarinimicrobiota bacterium]